ncbi:phosphotransferase family protein [Bosea caraganae]|uniref:Phosphotransferase family protein n=1 Tax=Bosea caraganae TaxID=2763117 RepID=A0A370L6C4_9HYPH|nr:phosphotransferase family protein [Bosea caraganae]RDJ23189.1 phosphotransferase family protein [Bosea caraganae]RDJ24698.1 phosphotransferase family protein [Bosea caraganae]
MTTGPAASAPEFDAARLDAFLAGALPGRVSGKMELERISGGQSNPTFFLSYPETGARLVLRKKPPGPLLPSAHAVDREYRILKALAGSNVPVPPVLLFHGEDDVVGTPFYLMERLDGRVFHDTTLPGVTPDERRQMYFAMADTLAALHRFDWQGAGLADYGKPGNYYARQLRRWGKQWRETKTRDIPAVDRLIDWLGAHLDASEETTIVHGDFRLGNLMFAPGEPHVIAVLDWELSTLGHPLSDAAFSCLPWHSTPDMYAGIVGIDREALGIPTQAEYLDRYCTAAGRKDGPGNFHIAFSLFRFAVILDGIAARAKAGNAAAENAVAVGEMAESFARRAEALIDA